MAGVGGMRGAERWGDRVEQKRFDGTVKDDTMLVNGTECPAMVAEVGHMGNVGLHDQPFD